MPENSNLDMCPRCVLEHAERGLGLGDLPKFLVAYQYPLVFCIEHDPNQKDIDDVTKLLTEAYHP